MQRSRGKISAINNGFVTLQVDRELICSRCAAGNGCGAGLFGAKTNATSIDIEMPSGGSLRIGEEVEVTLGSDRLLYAAFLAYGLPLVGMLAVLSLAWLWQGQVADGIAVALAVFGLLGGHRIGRSYLRKNRCLRQFVPSIVSASDR